MVYVRIETLKQFLVILQTQSINSAAQQLYISQQGLDAAIKRLEKELNVVLFQRTKTGIRLTKEGKLLSQYAKEIIKSYDSFQIELARQQLIKSPPQIVKIAVNPILSNILSEFFVSFNSTISNISYRFYELANEDIPEAVALNRFNMGIICYCKSKDIESSILYDPLPVLQSLNLVHNLLIFDELVVAMSYNNPLANQEVVKNDDLSNCGIALSNNTAFPYPQYKNNILLNSHDYKLHEQYLLHDDCISLLPAYIAKTAFNLDNIKLLSCWPRMTHYSLLIYPDSDKQTLSPEQILFYNSFKNFLENYSDT